MGRWQVLGGLELGGCLNQQQCTLQGDDSLPKPVERALPRLLQDFKGKGSLDPHIFTRGTHSSLRPFPGKGGFDQKRFTQWCWVEVPRLLTSSPKGCLPCRERGTSQIPIPLSRLNRDSLGHSQKAATWNQIPIEGSAAGTLEMVVVLLVSLGKKSTLNKNDTHRGVSQTWGPTHHTNTLTCTHLATLGGLNPGFCGTFGWSRGSFGRSVLLPLPIFLCLLVIGTGVRGR